MIITCPRCNSKLNVNDQMIGRRVQCAGCRHYFPVPAPPGHTPTAAPQQAPAPTAGPQPAPGPFSGNAPAPAPSTIPPIPTPRSTGPGFFRSLLSAVALGKVLILAGLTLVVLARGGDRIAARGVDRAKAKAELAPAEFNRLWDARIQEAQAEGDNKAVQGFRDSKAKKMKDLRDQWRELSDEAALAAIHNRINGYWLEWLYTLGSIVLAVGLLLLGFYGAGTERAVCLVMLAILTFALFVGGASFRFG